MLVSFALSQLSFYSVQFVATCAKTQSNARIFLSRIKSSGKEQQLENVWV